MKFALKRELDEMSQVRSSASEELACDGQLHLPWSKVFKLTHQKTPAQGNMQDFSEFDFLAGFGELDHVFFSDSWATAPLEGTAQGLSMNLLTNSTEEAQRLEKRVNPSSSSTPDLITPQIKSEGSASYETGQQALGASHCNGQSASSHSHQEQQQYQPQQQQLFWSGSTVMEPPTSNASSGQAPLHPSQAPPMFSPPSYTFPPPSAASTPSTTSTPASSGPDRPGPGYPALKAEPCSSKAAKPKRVRNNVGPKHQLEELQQVVAQKNQQIAQLLVENNRLKDTTG